MPGIHILAKSGSTQSQNVYGNESDFLHSPAYTLKKVISTPTIQAFSSIYPGYPFYQYNGAEITILIEGEIYNAKLSDIWTSLEKIFSESQKVEHISSEVSQLLLDWDGEFICTIHQKKSNRVFVFTDRWGRLPLYFFSNDETALIGRELKFLLTHIPQISLDRRGVMEFLSFGYTIGKRTLFEEVHFLPPSSLIELRTTGNRVSTSCSVLHPENFSYHANNFTREQHTQHLKDLFLQSVEHRANKTISSVKLILCDVSGGYDTRTVAVGLKDRKVSSQFITKTLISGDESPIAERVGKALHHNVTKISADYAAVDSAIIDHITYVTDGTVNVLASVTNYIDSGELRKTFKETAYEFMGFGGEFWRHPYRLKPYHTSVVDYIKENYLNKIKLTSEIVGVSTKSFLDSLHTTFQSFPEQDQVDKLRHLYYEYYRKLVGHGEDRHRKFFWTVQPLQSMKLFEYANFYLPHKLANYFFYIDFFKSLHSETEGIPLYGSRVRMNSPLSILFQKSLLYLRGIILNNRVIYRVVKKLAIFIEKARSRKSTPSLGKEQLHVLIHTYLTYGGNLLSTLDSKYIEKNFETFPIEYKHQVVTLLSYLSTVEKRFHSKTNAKKS